MKDNKGFRDRWSGHYDRLMSGDKDSYTRIANLIKRRLNKICMCWSLPAERVFCLCRET